MALEGEATEALNSVLDLRGVSGPEMTSALKKIQSPVSQIDLRGTQLEAPFLRELEQFLFSREKISNKIEERRNSFEVPESVGMSTQDSCKGFFLDMRWARPAGTEADLTALRAFLLFIAVKAEDVTRLGIGPFLLELGDLRTGAASNLDLSDQVRYPMFDFAELPKCYHNRFFHSKDVFSSTKAAWYWDQLWSPGLLQSWFIIIIF